MNKDEFTDLLEKVLDRVSEAIINSLDPDEYENFLELRWRVLPTLINEGWQYTSLVDPIDRVNIVEEYALSDIIKRYPWVPGIPKIENVEEIVREMSKDRLDDNVSTVDSYINAYHYYREWFEENPNADE